MAKPSYITVLINQFPKSPILKIEFIVRKNYEHNRVNSMNTFSTKEDQKECHQNVTEKLKISTHNNNNSELQNYIKVPSSCK